MRTTDELVQGLVEVDSGTDLSPFILTANELVTEVCASVLNEAGTAPKYSDTRLELIERWLAAHFYAMFDQGANVASEKAKTVAASYQHQVGLVLKFTRYGQQAMALDTAGGLAALNAKAEKGNAGGISLTYLGTVPPVAEQESED